MSRKPPTLAEERHHKGLRAVAAALTQPDPLDALRQAQEAGALDHALYGHARPLARLDQCTTATLRLTRHSALMALRWLIDPLADEWSHLNLDSPHVDETTLNLLGDQARVIAEFAEALATDAFRWDWTQDTLRAQERERAKEAARERERQAAQNTVRQPLVQPSTAERLQALRSEFSTDPEGIDFLIRLADRLAGHPAGAADEHPAGDTNDVQQTTEETTSEPV